MKAPLFFLFFWLFSVWLETVFCSSFSWFQPNMFFAAPIALCLQWRGPETHFIFLFFGLTADSFSTLPFGIFGLTFFILSFFTRQAAGARQDSALSSSRALVVSAVSILLLDILILLILFVWFGEETSGWEWLTSLLLNEAAPTAVVSVLLSQALKKIEQKYQIKLGEK